MAVRVSVEPSLLAWAVDRAQIPSEEISHRFPQFRNWEAGTLDPTLKQLESFANATHAPLGWFFLPAPPTEVVPIPDFRTLGSVNIGTPSPDLLDTIYLCQMRQEWYQGFARNRGYDPLPFVGSATLESAIEPVADEIRRAISFGLDGRAGFQNWEAALRQLIDSIEDIGVLVMVSGIVGNNTHRRLRPEEFRGFALASEVAPLIFVNGADTKAAQIFTLIHELAHIWLGESALSDAPLATTSANRSELWCNRVAAEVLVPLNSLLTEFRGSADLDELRRLSKLYRVSTLVVLKRIFDADLLSWDEFKSRYDEERSRLVALIEEHRGNGGGNYYYTQPLRLSRHFMRAVFVDTFEGRTLHRDAYELLGTRKHETFVRLAEELGVQ